MLIEAKVFTSLSNSLGAVRKNTGAIRKTLLNNRKTTEKSQKQLKLQEGLLKDQKRKEEREGQLEKKQGKAAGAFNSKKYFGNPERALDGPITGGLGGFLNRIVLFFSFTLLGWMLKALPKIIKAVKTFMSKAKEFMKKLEGFFGGVKSFAINISNAVGSLFGKITQNKDLGEGEETKVRDMISGMIDSIMTFIKDLPGRVGSMIMGLVGMHNDAQKKIKQGVNEDEALESSVKEYQKLSGAKGADTQTSAASLTTLTPLVGTRGFIQGGSGFGAEGEYATHFHLSPPSDDADGHEKARAVAFKAVRLMLARGSTVYFGNTKEFATSSLSDPKLKEMIRREQVAHTQPGRTQGGIDIQEQEPGKPLTIPGQPGTASVFPLTTGEIVTDVSSSGGRMAKILGSGGVMIAHGAAGSTASGAGSLPVSMQVDRSSTVERADTLASDSPKKKITIDKEIPIDVSKIRTRNKAKRDAFAAASEITIEVVSIDGNVTPGGMFE